MVLLKCRSVRRRPPGEQWSRRETIEARRTKWNFDVEMDSGISGPHVQMKGCRQRRQGRRFPQLSPLALPPDSHMCLKCEVKECTRKALLSGLSGPKSAELPDARRARLPVQGSPHTRECKTYQDAWEDSRRTASAEEARRGIGRDPDTRPLDPSSSSTDPNPKR